MDIYIAWWDWCDGWEHSEGILGLFSTEQEAIAVAKAYADSQNESYAGSRVTSAKLDEKGGGYFTNVLHSFESIEKPYDEDEDNYEDD